MKVQVNIIPTVKPPLGVSRNEAMSKTGIYQVFAPSGATPVSYQPHWLLSGGHPDIFVYINGENEFKVAELSTDKSFLDYRFVLRNDISITIPAL